MEAIGLSFSVVPVLVGAVIVFNTILHLCVLII